MPNPLGRALRHRRAGQDSLVWADPDLRVAENFTLTSPGFDHGGPIPSRHRGRVFGANVSPALAWSAPPTGTDELLLIVQDADSPGRRPATHAVTRGIDPGGLHLPESALVEPSPFEGLSHGRGPLGRLGYVGPAPIPSHGPHSYVFQLFALDRRPDLPPRFTVDDAVGAMVGHLLGRARLDGTYEIR
ncbi:YbhB/YbcL family Raf kinase inhibitor-like protein [Frondihabitans cladoniiphilus]|uniref:YbhB/YbcL family Raf kinase inhibitor-like protein n=1 Tax=Frondihabitans cladoniiphilus TaxID=715785 RepID=A0ABP8WBY8_9MICO